MNHCLKFHINDYWDNYKNKYDKLISDKISIYNAICNTDEYKKNISVENLCYFSSNFNKVGNRSKNTILLKNLKNAYSFAKNNKISIENIQICHKIISKGILEQNYQGNLRNEALCIKTTGISNSNLLSPRYVVFCFNDLIQKINILCSKDFSNTEIFYYSSIIHYIFLTIHPFWDFNGKIARLLEKWLLSRKLGEDFWLFPTEKFYFFNKETYYRKLNIAQKDNEKINDFLSLLPNIVFKY